MQVHKWAGEKLDGEYLSIDTETTNIQPGEIPSLVILQASSDGENSYIVERDDVGDFLNLHRHSHWVGHNFCFDLAVLSKLLNTTFYNKIEHEEIWDTGIAFRLLSLTRGPQVSFLWSMAYCAEKLLGITVDKDDSTRMGWTLSMNYETMGDARLKYSALDAIITWKLWEKLKVIREHPNALSHNTQLKGAIALEDISRNGMRFDLAKKEEVTSALYGEMKALGQKLKDNLGWQKGVKGNNAIIQNYLKQFELSEGVKLPRTETANAVNKKGKTNPDKIKSDGATIEKYLSEDIVMSDFITYKELEKMVSFVSKIETDRVHPFFNTILNTGRVSCSKPNLQQLPRKGSIRQCFIADEGCVFVDSDYSGIELVALGQICINRFGFSVLADKINADIDLHKYLGSIVYKKEMEMVTKDERQLCKALNFSLPVNVGANKLCQLIKLGTGKDVSEDDALFLKKAYLEAFPEVSLFYESHMDKHDFTSSPFNSPDIARAVFRRIMYGVTDNTKGEPYGQNILAWAINFMLPRIRPDLVEWDLGEKLGREIFSETIVLPNGFTRAKCSYTEARNVQFQGLAASGMKISLFNLLKERYKVNMVIHDQVLVSIPDDKNKKEKALHISDIMVKSMSEVIPNVKIKTEWGCSKKWFKNTKEVYDLEGNLLIYEE